MKRWLCSKLKIRRQDKKSFWSLQITLRNLKRSQHKSNCQRPREPCSRSKMSVSFLFDVRYPVLHLSRYKNECSYYSSLFFSMPISNSDFKLFLLKKFQFHSCSMCATPYFVCHGGKTSSHVASGTKTFWAPVLCQYTAKLCQIPFEVAFEFSYW